MDVFKLSQMSTPQKRASKPKVRTGCLRCKQRHVKCDETKPGCSACTRSGVDCQYIILERKKQQRRSRPKASDQPPPLAVLRSTQSDEHNLPRVPRGLVFGPKTTAIEAVYLSQYQIIANAELAHPELWNRAMLRESVRDECIRHALMAIGALSKAIYGNPDPAVRRLCLTAPSLLSDVHYQAGLLHYSTALRICRKRLAQDGAVTDPRSILMATFLFIALHNMQDDCKAVDVLMANGVHLLSKQLACFRYDGRRVAASVDDDGVAVAEYLLPRLSIMSSSSVPLYPSVKRIPFHVAAQLPPIVFPETSDSLYPLRLAWEKCSTYYAFWMFRCIQTMAQSLPFEENQFTKQQTAIHQQLDQWETVVKHTLSAEIDAAKTRALKLVLVGIKSVYGMIACFADQTMMAWDAYTPLFSETLDLIDSVMASPRPASGKNSEYIFDDALVPTVDSLSQWCRDKQLRQRTQVLQEELARSSRTWGPTPREKTARVGVQVVVAVEELGRNPDGFIPMEARYQWTGAAWNDDRTELTVTLTGAARDSNGMRSEKVVLYQHSTGTIIFR